MPGCQVLDVSWFLQFCLCAFVPCAFVRVKLRGSKDAAASRNRPLGIWLREQTNPLDKPIGIALLCERRRGLRDDKLNSAICHLKTRERGEKNRMPKLSDFLASPHCLKITQNVAFEFWHFSPIFVLLKLTCLVTLFDRKLQVYKNSPKWTIFGIFN